MCLSIVTPKNNKFSMVLNGKLIILKCPKILANYILNIISLNIGTPKNINFLFVPNGKSMVLIVPILTHFRVIVLGVPILKHIRVSVKVSTMTHVLIK